MISYEPFWTTLKSNHITIYYLINKCGINPNTITCIKKGRGITTFTLNNLCAALDCEVSDIIAYIPDPPHSDELPSGL